MTKIQIEFKPELFLLGLLGTNYGKENEYLILHVLTAARIVFAQFWKNEDLPSDQTTITKILECAEMDRLTLEIKEKEDSIYFKTWENFYQWLVIR